MRKPSSTAGWLSEPWLRRPRASVSEITIASSAGATGVHFVRRVAHFRSWTEGTAAAQAQQRSVAAGRMDERHRRRRSKD
jgi:hypothetical protein